MKYVIFIYSNPQPWGHPTGDFVQEVKDLDPERRKELNQGFDDMLAELSQRGELIGGEPLASPAQARILRWVGDGPVMTDGPYAEGKEHLAGFFLIDVESQERAEEIFAKFAGPGEAMELRPIMSFTGDTE